MKKKIIIEIIIHIIFWIITCKFFIPNSFLRYQPLDIRKEYFSLFLIITITYFNYFYLIPSFFQRQKFIIYFLSMFSLIVLICTLEFVQIRIDILKYTANADIDFQNGTLRFNFFGIFFRDTLFVAFFTMFKIYRDAIKSYKILQEKTYLERINFINQIEMQKSKINTHFFFNTLHSIQAMAANKSDNTAEALNNLSLLMKYIVVDSEDIMISLQKEIIFLQRYIELEKIRKPDVNLKFEVDGNANNYLVPPMIFEAFVNNAFKYNDHLANGLIEIKISCQGKDILFICQNAVDKSIKPSVSSTGKGLQNTINRLNLHYKNHHQLEIDDNEKYYSLSLLLKGRF